MKIKANAKINLALNVIKKRKDGYHEMDMIMTPISLHDTLEVSLAKQDRFTSNCDLAFDESNTIIKALQVMRKAFSLTQHFHVHLEKRIPMQAGLAGGSADGAAMLVAINELCELHLDKEQLYELGVQVGADVPFCLANELARVQGIGEKITQIKATLDVSGLVVKPASGVSTKEAFGAIDFTQAVHPDIDAIITYIKHNDDRYLELLDNTLEQPSLSLNPDILEVKQALNRYKFPVVLMSGSGSSVFALSKDRKQLEKAKEELSRIYAFVELIELHT